MKIDPGRDILNYRITQELGHGGMGKVYKAVHLALERTVAIKAIHPRLLRSQSMVERFYHEAKIQARLNHQNIVTIYDFFEYDGNYFIVMEFVEGESISKIITHQGPFEIKLGLTIFRHILDGISYAHQKAVIHKDIKTSNFLLTPKNVKITDFGIAQIVGDTKGNSSQEGIIGTPKYMSPELILGEKKIDHRTDIYSLGITIYEFLTGKVPFGSNHESDMEIRKAQVMEPPSSPRSLNPDISKKLESIIFKSLEKNPGDRFQTSDEFIEEIDKLDFSKPDNGINRILGFTRSKDTTAKNSGKTEKIKTENSTDTPGLKGNLREINFASLLSSHHYRKSSGCLEIISDTKLRIYFKNGYVEFVDCEDPDLLLGKLLVANKKITEKDNQNVIDFSNDTGLKIGEALIKLRKLSPHDLGHILELQIKLKMLNGFRLKNGTYRFLEEHQLKPDTFFRVDPIQIIYDAMDSYILSDEFELSEDELNGTIHPHSRLSEKTSELTFSSSRQYKLVKMLRSPVIISNLISASPLDRTNTIRFLKFLVISQLIKIEKSTFARKTQIESSDETILLSDEQIESELKNIFNKINPG